MINFGRRKSVLEVLTSFPLIKLVGEFRKKDEARLRSMSPVDAPGVGGVDVGEERIG